jgi:replicative DNA helicase
MEMKEKRIVRRILAAKTEAGAIGSRDAKEIPDSKWHRVCESAAQLASLPLYIDDSAGLTIPVFRSRLRRYKKEFDIRFGIVDYVGLMDGPGRTITEQATGIAKGLRRLAKEEDVAIVALSQLHRPREGNPNERPTMLSLRNSGDFEANADVVLLIHRPMDLETSTFTGEDEIILGKARDGACGSIPVLYDEETLTCKPRKRYA